MDIETYFSEEYLTNLFNNKFKSSKSKGIDKLNSENIKSNLKELCEIIERKVLSDSYVFSPYLEILKLKGRDKLPRIISIPTMRDRIVLSTIKDILHIKFPLSVNRKLPNSYIRDIKRFLNEKETDFHYLKIDIKQFYDRIDRYLLLKKLENGGLDSKVINLISNAISTPTVPSNTRKGNYNKYQEGVGIPQGLSISNILAQIYLHEFDSTLKRRSFFYKRYVDDILILNEKAVSPTRFKNIEKELAKIKLELNSQKTEQNLLTISNFTFLSYNISSKVISIAEKNIELFIRRIAGKFTWFKKGIKNPSSRPKWIGENNERFKEVFIEELNENITGIISLKKNYGWLFYFSEMSDKNLLFRIDKIIASFFKDLSLFDNKKPTNLKTLVRTFYVIKHGNSKSYIPNYDIFDTTRKKRNFLIFRGKIDPYFNYSNLEIELYFENFRKNQLKNLEKDLGYKYL